MSNPDKPVGIVAVLKNGRRIPIELRQTGVEGFHVIWEPIIEGDIRKFMPDVVSLEAEYWPHTAGVRFPDEQTLGEEWGEAVAANSPVVGHYVPHYLSEDEDGQRR